MSVYRESELIRSALDSVVELVDGIVILDGPYLGAAQLPDDGTAEIATGFSPKVNYIKTPVLRETEKRSLFFRMLPEGDWLLILDGDESLELKVGVGEFWGNASERFRAFIRSRPESDELLWLEMSAFNPKSQAYENLQPRPRLVRVKKGIHYHVHHRNLYRADGSLLTDTNWSSSGTCPLVPGASIINWYDCRTDKARRQAWLDYGRTMSVLAWDERKLQDSPTDAPPDQDGARLQH